MLEEEVLDTHKLVMDSTTKFLNDAHSVFSATHEVDYDQEGKTKSSPFALVSIGFCLLPLLSFTLHYIKWCIFVKKKNELNVHKVFFSFCVYSYRTNYSFLFLSIKTIFENKDFIYTFNMRI